MTTQQKIVPYRSFLLRLWQEEKEGASVIWQAEIESIQTGRKWQFANPETMFNFLRTQIEGSDYPNSEHAQRL